MNPPHQPLLGIVGAGKVGSTLARLGYRAGYRVAAVYSPNHAEALAGHVNAPVVTTPDAVIELADLTLLTVPDDRIAAVSAAIQIADMSGRGVIHTSGVHDASLLGALAERGAMVGSLHPAFPFADVDTAMWNVPGAAFAVEAEDDRLRDWLLGLVRALDGRALTIWAEHKALYHSALVLASNYTVTLYALAEHILLSLGADRGAADHALNTLVAATVANLRRQGIPDALTGPLVRGDVGTIRAHLQALAEFDADVTRLYRLLGRLSLPLLDSDNPRLEQIGSLLQE